MEKSKTEKSHKKEEMKYVVKGSIDQSKVKQEPKKSKDTQDKKNKEFIPVCLNEETDSI